MLLYQRVTSETGETIGRHGLRRDGEPGLNLGCAEESCKHCKLCFHEVMIIVKVTKQPKSFFFGGRRLAMT